MGLLIWLLSAGAFLLLVGAFVKADLNDMGITFEWRRKARAKTREQADREPICLCEDLYTEHDLETGACRVKNCVCVTYLGPDPILSGLWSPSFSSLSTQARQSPASTRSYLATKEVADMALMQAAEAFRRGGDKNYTTDDVVSALMTGVSSTTKALTGTVAWPVGR